MGLENLVGVDKFLDDLVPSNPVGGQDTLSEADDHIRGIKNVLLNTFPALNAACGANPAEFNRLVGLLASTAELNVLNGALLSTAELNILAGALVSTAEINYLQGVTSNVQAQLDALSKPAAPSGHQRAGNMVLVDGSVSTVGDTSFNLSGPIPVNTWESIGPTGSGADNIWTELDAITTKGKIALIEWDPDADNNSTSAMQVQLWAAPGDVVTPTDGEHTLRYNWQLDFDANVSGTQRNRRRIMIPLDDDKVFKVRWNITNGTVSFCSMYYRGFITDA